MKSFKSLIFTVTCLSLFAVLPAPVFARTFSLSVEPSSSTLAPGGSTLVDVYLWETTGNVLSTIGLSVATIKVDVISSPVPGATSAELSAITPAAPFLTGPADPTPGVFTLFTPDPSFLGVQSSTGRLHIATLAITLPNTGLGGAPTRFGISAFDDFQFISATDFQSESAGSIGSVMFDVNVTAAAVPAPLSALSGGALLSGLGLCRRRNRFAA